VIFRFVGIKDTNYYPNAIKWKIAVILHCNMWVINNNLFIHLVFKLTTNYMMWNDGECRYNAQRVLCMRQQRLPITTTVSVYFTGVVLSIVIVIVGWLFGFMVFNANFNNISVIYLGLSLQDFKIFLLSNIFTISVADKG
jgi:hypothetical protein